jgi:hypothetical protein
MSNGVLQFTLGLTTGGFLSNLGGATVALKGFTAAAAGLGAMTAGVMHAIDQGTELDRLHHRLNTSAGDLFKLQRGFEAAGLSADDVSPLVFKLQKSLGGMNEMGQSTRVMFNNLGLSLTGLKRMKAPEQLLAIAGALAKMDTESAAAVAGGIFGREGAANMIQLAHSSNLFAQALAKSAHDAEIWQRNANVFAKLNRDTGEIKSHVATMFAGIAEGAAPGIQAIEDRLNTMDLSGLGQQFGKGLSALLEGFQEGKLSELIALSLKTGFDMGVAGLPPILEKIGYMLIKMFETPLEYLQAGMDYVFTESLLSPKGGARAALNNYSRLIPGVNLGDTIFGNGTRDFNSYFEERKKSGLKFNVGTGDFGLTDINKDADKRWADAKKQMALISQPWLALLQGLASRAPKVLGAGDTTGGTSTAGIAGESHWKPEGTSLEKMGFVMGGNNSLLDFSRRTAAATEKTAAGVARLVAATNFGISETLNVVNSV